MRFKAGVKSSAGCALCGQTVDVHDRSGTVIASGTLGATPWPGTGALYWCEMDAPAPTLEGITTLTVRFRADGLTPPHVGAVANADIAVAKPPEHSLTITVVEKGSAAPVADVVLRLGAYRARTDGSGIAVVPVCAGEYDLRIWKAGYEAEPARVTVAGDAAIRIAAPALPEENADRAWKM
jgi:hypothetical protein